MPEHRPAAGGTPIGGHWGQAICPGIARGERASWGQLANCLEAILKRKKFEHDRD